jgi:hypothetical protein
VVLAFLDLAVDSVLSDYILKNVVRHIFGYDGERLAELARGVLSDYSLLLAVARRQLLSFSANHDSDFVNHVREWRENHEGNKVNDDGEEFERGFTGDLENIADMISVFVPTSAVDLGD